MKFFKNPNIVMGIVRDALTGWYTTAPVNPKKENKMMEEAGFIIDRENGLYIKEEYGAYMRDIEDFEMIKDLRNCYDPSLGMNPFKEYIRLMDEEGYELVIGDGAPDSFGKICGKGLYCKNYNEIINKHKREKSERELSK